ncbi:substrate-binding periplasmic protein [Parachitinimonas caeni]|uniref:ABC transporter substrate-binding protein n=1 Tax=Parachitinimonas caeni TaxID=3031301 RepID=A0ABT7DU98_9NEIS|nr:ABC transporter substrate-binding protein [Parachitinimonas caeni]MDK2123384.1 ABC transporter substrate-binding protein [Parachitinimonas caeni]
MKYPAIWLGGCLLCSVAIAEEPVRLAIGDWPPYTSPSNPKAKLIERIVTEAFRLEGLRTEYEYLPWKRSYLYVQEGKSDGTFPWNKTDEREREFIYNKIPLVRDEGVYFHLKSTKFDWHVFDDIRKYKVGYTIGYKQEQLYKKSGIEADPAMTADLNFKKMLAGRIDVYHTSKVVGYALINEHFTPAERKLFTHHPKVIEENVYYLLFSRKTPNGQQLADKLDAGLQKMIDSGAYAKLVAEYTEPSP